MRKKWGLVALGIAVLSLMVVAQRQGKLRDPFMQRLEANGRRFFETCMLCGEGWKQGNYSPFVTIHFRSPNGLPVSDSALVCPKCVGVFGWPLPLANQEVVLQHWIARRLYEDVTQLRGQEEAVLMDAREDGIRKAGLDPKLLESPDIFMVPTRPSFR